MQAYALDCSNATASPNLLWPPNHKMAKIQIKGLGNANVTVQCISQDEPLNDSGDGNTEFDASGSGSPYAYVRQERTGGGNGRVYHIDFKATNDLLEQCFGSVQVGVPPSKKKRVTDDGALYYSVEDTSLCGTDVSNLPPVIQTQALPTVYLGNTYEYDVDATDPEGAALSYALINAPTSMQINRDSGLISWVPSESQVGEHTVQVIVIDDQDASATQEFTINVLPPLNSVPVITSTPITQASVGIAYTYQVLANDLDNDPLSFQLDMAPERMTITEHGLIQWIATNNDVTDHTVSISVYDGQGGVAYQSFSLNVPEANSDPIISSEPVPQAWVNQSYQYQVIASDADGDSLAYQLAVYPLGMQIDQTGLISWIPADIEVGDHTIEAQVADGRGGLTVQSYVLSVTIPNHNPVIVSEPVLSGPTRLEYTYQVQAQDEDGDSLSYNLITAPETMRISESGLISWTPAIGAEGEYTIDILVTDGHEGSASQSYVLTIFPRPNTAPTISSLPETDVWVGSTFSYQITATDAEDDPITLSLVGAPEQANLSLETGLLTWSTLPSDTGAHEIIIQATDDTGAFSTQTFILNVNALPNVAPVAQNQSISISQGGTSSLVLTGYDADQDALHFTVVQAPKYGTILGTAPNLQYIPNESFTGQDTLYFVVSDHKSTSSPAKIDITILPVNHAPRIISEPPSLAVKQGDAFNYPVSAVDTDGDVLSFTMTGPSSAVMSSAGTISFDTSTIAPGSYSFSVLVSDPDGAQDQQNFSLSVLEATVQTFQITSTPEPKAYANSTYTYALSTNQDPSQVTYELLAGDGSAYLDGDTLNWQPATEQMLEKDIKLSMCANYDDFIIGAAGSASVYAESNIDAKRFPRIYKPIHPTLFDTTNIDNQINLGVIARDLVAEKWGFTDTYSYTGTEPTWRGVLTRLIIPEEQGRVLGFTSGQYSFKYPSSRGAYEDRSLSFHNDTWAERYSHDVCERYDENGQKIDNFGMISGNSLDTWLGCRIKDWGSYNVIEAMPEPRLWRSDLVILNASVTHPEQVTIEVSNRGLANSTQFTVSVAERIGESFETRGEIRVVPLNNLGSQTVTVNLNQAVSSDLVVSIDYPNKEIFECLPSNQQAVLKHFTVKAILNSGLVDTQDFWLPVVNDKLEVLNEMPAKVYEGANYIYRPEVAGGSGNYSYAKTSGPSTASFNENNELVWEVELGSAGNHLIEIAVQDDQGAVAHRAVSVNVLPAITNERPVVLSSPPLDAIVGQEYRYQLVVEEPDGEEMTFRTEVGQIDENNVLTWTPTLAEYNWWLGRGGFRTLVVEIRDSQGALTLHNWGVNMHLAAEYQNAPIIYDLLSTTVKVNQQVNFTLFATNPLGGALSFELVEPPVGMSISSSGKVQWQPDESQIGYHFVRVLVSNAEASNYADIGIKVEPLVGIISQPKVFAPVSELYQYQLETTIANASFSLVAAPAGMTINSAGLISWSPSVSDIGAHEVLVRAADSGNDVSSQQFTLNVFENIGINNPPVITSVPPATSSVGNLYTYTVQAQDIENDPLTYTLSSAPVGMAIDANQGVINWTPSSNQEGVHTINVVVSDSQGNTASQGFTILTSAEQIVIDEGTGNNQANLSLINQPKTMAIVGQLYVYRASGFSDQGGAVTVSLVNGPAGMTITPNKPFPGYFELAWTPDTGNCQHDVTLELADSFGNTQQITYTLDVYNAPKKQNRFQCSVDAEFCATR
tara:strand:- start:3510 stop:8678 length:5169 start_codon:yes stop_codon:yes gene_type:complete